MVRGDNNGPETEALALIHRSVHFRQAACPSRRGLPIILENFRPKNNVLNQQKTNKQKSILTVVAGHAWRLTDQLFNGPMTSLLASRFLKQVKKWENVLPKGKCLLCSILTTKS